ncbi:MAG: arsenate reductase ArsC [Methanobacterium sp.]|uniref:arsenate reductase ArsC n=1 Tax=Methanobacterium sp. TaxID=2164 RepID=UPI003D658D5E|nr:arsenate reductase ArsC [Methanobacterium sp.]
MTFNKKKIIFICKNNSGRSQMAESIFKQAYGEYYEVYSAGSDPKEINPLTIKVLEEIGIDTSLNRSKSLKEFQEYEFDYVVSLCGDEEGSCPTFLKGKKHIYHGFNDPKSFGGDKKAKLKLFRAIRDEINDWIRNSLVDEIK